MEIHSSSVSPEIEDNFRRDVDGSDVDVDGDDFDVDGLDVGGDDVDVDDVDVDGDDGGRDLDSISYEINNCIIYINYTTYLFYK